MAAEPSSGSYLFDPDVASAAIEAFSRIQIRGPQLEPMHLQEARRSANLALARWPTKSGAALWAVGDKQLMIPLQAGINNYLCPGELIDILDAYVRTYTPDTTTTTIGATLTPMVMIPGQPMVTQAGDPMTTTPGSGALSSVAGSQTITLNWPRHGLQAGSPIFITGIMSVGGVALSGFVIADSVVDANNVTFLAPTPATETQTGQGAPPLFTTTNASTSISVIYPNHGQTVGATFNVPIATTGGGVTLSGDYAVASIISSYEFTITAASQATSTASFFQNGGQFQVATQLAGTQWTDVFMWPLSRDEYAMLPDKLNPGRPTQFWLNRTIIPQLAIWPVPNASQVYGFIAYRVRRLQDATLSGGQTLDMPSRFWDAFVCDLTARLAEKFKPEMHMAKLALAAAAWADAVAEDRERVSLYISPDLGAYFC